jgi:hypothetical protein
MGKGEGGSRDDVNIEDKVVHHAVNSDSGARNMKSRDRMVTGVTGPNVLGEMQATTPRSAGKGQVVRTGGG